MKRTHLLHRLCLMVFMMLCTFVLFAQNGHILQFNTAGKFKIVQFTDVHYKYDNPNSDAAIERINEVIDAENPDLVVFTGDIIYSTPADKGMRTVLEQASKRNIPFVALFGNHDDEFQMSRSELYDLIRTIPHHMMPDRGELVSPDYALTIKSSTDSSKDEALLYFLDSNAYSTLKDVKGYGWIGFEQVQWYREQSKAFTARNNETPMPALAFFHIPLPEYDTAANDGSSILRGNRLEKVCAPQLNSGMFLAMKEAGDVMGTFCGHDHDNDYAVMYHHILLAYGRYTGGNTVYNHLPNGARVIELSEGTRTFETWIRTKGGETHHRYTYPNDFIKE